MAGEISCKIIEEIGVLRESAKGWRKELNIVNWNDKGPKYDLRKWSPGHDKSGKGVTLTEDECKALLELLKTRFELNRYLCD